MSMSETASKDKQIVRELAKHAAEIAALPIQKEKRELWRRVNDLQPVRPVVLIFGGGVTWSEMNDDTLICQATDPYYRGQEWHWRQLLFRWEHVRCDMVIEPFVECPLFINNSGIGLPGWGDASLAEKIVYSEKYKEWPSRKFKPAIYSEEDFFNRFHMPVISVNTEGSREYFEKTKDLYDGILEVRQKGLTSGTFWPWNDVSVWLGLEETMTAMVDNPDLLHTIMRHVTDATLDSIDQCERLGLYSTISGNNNTGNGGYAYTNDLPSDSSVKTVRGANALWCSVAAEIFTCVSPEMHEEFALNYESEVMKKFGLSCYGCCERLDNKIHLMDKIPNMRKISVSAFANPENAAELLGNRYVYSYKPDNTAISSHRWDAEETRKTLRNVVTMAKQHNCSVEIIMNAVSTLQNEPRRIFEWAEMAQRIVTDY